MKREKYRLYIDEVGHANLGAAASEEGRYLCLAGVALSLLHVQQVVQPALARLKQKYFDSHPDEPVILHREDVVRRKRAFSVLKDEGTRLAFDQDLLHLLDDAEFTVIAVVIDKQQQNNIYDQTWKYDPYHYCQEVLLERYRLFLDVNNAVGDVMIESRGGKEDMRLKTSFRRLMESGTHYLKAEQLKQVITSLDLKVKKKDANIAGLQLADLIAHPVRRYAFQKVWGKEDGLTTFSDRINQMLEQKKFFRYKGRILGFGLKTLP